MLPFIRKHPIGVGAGAAVVLAGLAWLAFGFFGVQTLFIDEVVDESGPVFDAEPVALETGPTTPTAGTSSGDPASENPDAAETPTAEATASEEATVDPEPATTVAEPATAPAEESGTPETVTEFAGTFESDAHPTAGVASVLGNGTGQRFLRFENFETDNGPDLNVYLVNSSTGDVSDYVDLGDLKGNIGDQNYEIPEGVDLTVYDEVVVWCVRFGVGFGDALLMPV